MPSQNNNPRGNKPQTPPDIDELLQKGIERLKSFFAGGGSGGGSNGSGSVGVFTIAILLAVGFSAWSAYYTVPSDSVAVVQRFGKYISEVPPG